MLDEYKFVIAILFLYNYNIIFVIPYLILSIALSTASLS